MTSENVRPEFDKLFIDIADYVLKKSIDSQLAIDTARYCLMDSLGCAILALNYPACTKLLGPVVPNISVKQGCRIPGTQFELDPVQAAFNIGAMIRWLDFNDTWLAAEWGHPSDNLGAILSVTDHMIRQGKNPYTVRDVLIAAIKAHEIQGILALENSFNAVGLDHVVLVKTASTALATFLLGGSRQQIINALSQVFVDGQSLRTYRHAPNTGSRKSWAAGDATRRAVQLALISLTNEMGYPSALTAKRWGFDDVTYKGNSLKVPQDFGSYVMENVLFKISFPAEFHAQTAVEAAIELHPKIIDRIKEIKKIEIETQASAVRIIDKKGPLHNPADRDHCLQYMTAIGLLFGSLTAEDYEDNRAKDPRIDQLRDKMVVKENPRFTREYLESDKRSIGNSVQVFFEDGTQTDKISIDYPIGHKRRRAEGIPLLLEKFHKNLSTQFSGKQVDAIQLIFNDHEKLMKMPVDKFMDLFWLGSADMSHMK